MAFLCRVQGTMANHAKFPVMTEILFDSPSDGGIVPSVDEALLTALVQDVWDKFLQQRSMLLNRQRHEAQVLWLQQRDHWKSRAGELGKVLCH